jgi:hypothetical protein
LANSIGKFLKTAHAEDGFVLPRKRSLVQILRHPRRTHGQRPTIKFSRNLTQGILYFRRHLSCKYLLAWLAFIQPIARYKMIKRLGCEGKAMGDRKSSPGQFAQIGRLRSHAAGVRTRQIPQRQDIGRIY